MRWFSEQRARWAVVLYSLIFISLLLASCATAPFSKKYVGPISDSISQDHRAKSFQSLWEKWTVKFGTAARDKGFGPLSTPLAMMGGRGPSDGRSEFPLQIAATLMDSLLIEAGLQYYATLLMITPEERAEFRRAYFERYDPTNHLLIWCKIRTRWADSYLDRERWIIFLEDDAGNQYEPVRIVEGSLPIRQMVSERRSGFQPEKERWGWKVHQKTSMLCFPQLDFHENPIRSESLRSLKLVFQLSDDKKNRAEGIWIFKR